MPFLFYLFRPPRLVSLIVIVMYLCFFLCVLYTCNVLVSFHVKVETLWERRLFDYWNLFLSRVSISDFPCFKLLGGGGGGTKPHALKLFCLLVFLIIRSIESPGRHVHSYLLHIGPSCRHRQKCSVSARGDFASISPASCGGRRGIELILQFSFIFDINLLYLFISHTMFMFS